MTDGQALREALSRWRKADIDLEITTTDGLLERIRQVLLAARLRGRLSPEDLIPLLRQWLLRDYPHGAPQWLIVPRDELWPSRTRWEHEGFEVAEFTDRNEIKAALPRLAFLAFQQDLFDDAFHALEAKRPERVPAEGHIGKLLGTTTFTGQGQREAVRAGHHAHREPSDRERKVGPGSVATSSRRRRATDAGHCSDRRAGHRPA
jgi:hypothetical protein